MHNCSFEAIIEVKTLGAQLTSIKIIFNEEMQQENISLDTYEFSIYSENTNNIWHKIPIVGLKWIDKQTLYLNLIEDIDFIPLKLLKLIRKSPNVFTQKYCNLNYKLKQNKNLYTQSGKIYDTTTTYNFSKEQKLGIDDFTQDIFKDIHYSLYTPQIKADKHSLIVWLHGAGEGGINTSNIMADRGAITYLNQDTQYLFQGAYVLAPQCPTYWLKKFKMEDDIWVEGARDYTHDLTALIQEIKQKYTDIDEQRIYLVGASMGGYQVLRLLADNPTQYAGAIISCPAQIPEDSDLAIIKNHRIPLWLLHCTKDKIVDKHHTKYIFNYLNDSLDNQDMLKVTYYPKVEIQGKEIESHCVFIYMYDNLPEDNGIRLFNWLSKQKRG